MLFSVTSMCNIYLFLNLRLHKKSVLSTKIYKIYSITDSCSVFIIYINESTTSQYKIFTVFHTIYILNIMMKITLLSILT